MENLEFLDILCVQYYRKSVLHLVIACFLFKIKQMQYIFAEIFGPPINLSYDRGGGGLMCPPFFLLFSKNLSPRPNP